MDGAYLATGSPALFIENLVKLIANKELHFLNIDIEGLEDGIIKSLLNKKILPWCIAIEELGQTCENISRSKIKKFMNKTEFLQLNKSCSAI